MSKGMMVVLRHDHGVERHEITSDTAYDAIREAVGGYIEAIPNFDTWLVVEDGKILPMPCVAFCHEEGKLLGLPLNSAATQAWWQCVATRRVDDYLVGNIAIVYGDEKFLQEL